MKQTRLMSLVEALANVVVGYGLAVATQLIVFPLFGLPADVGAAASIGAILTGISIVRSFVLRAASADRRRLLYSVSSMRRRAAEAAPIPSDRRTKQPPGARRPTK